MSTTPAVALVEAAVVKQDDAAIDVTAALDIEKAETLTADVTTTTADMRKVSAARVNMRQGPGQNFSVVAKLTNGQMVKILQDPGDGWVKLRVEDGGRVGWMADFLLTASNN